MESPEYSFTVHTILSHPFVTDIAIVENLSKRYRIGVADEQHDTLVGATLGAIRNPARNFQRLRH